MYPSGPPGVHRTVSRSAGLELVSLASSSINIESGPGGLTREVEIWNISIAHLYEFGFGIYLFGEFSDRVA